MSSIFKNTGGTTAPRPAGKGSKYHRGKGKEKPSQPQSGDTDGMSSQLSAIDEQLATIGDSLTTFSKGIDKFDKKVTKHDEDVSDLGVDIAAAKPSASSDDSLSELLDELRDRKGTKYGKQFTNLANQIDSIKDDYPEETLMRALQSGVDQISQFTVDDLKEIDAMGDSSRR
jgi:hypothetical protein